MNNPDLPSEPLVASERQKARPSSSAEPLAAPESFWFGMSGSGSRLRALRCLFGGLFAYYFASHIADIGLWFSGDGLLGPRQVGRFLTAADLTDAAWWRWSPLYLVTSTMLLRIYLFLGIAISIASIVWWRSRWLAFAAWLGVLALANRVLVIDGGEELVLSAAGMYLAIPTRLDIDHWSQSFSLRLFQVHSTLLMLATGLTMLASGIWWDGTGSASVAAPEGRRWIALSDWLSSPWIYEPLSHAIVAGALLLPILWWWPQKTPIAKNDERLLRATVLIAWIWCGLLAVLSSQWLYFASVAAMCASVWMPRRWLVMHQSADQGPISS